MSHEDKEQDTDSDTQSVGRVVEELVRASKEDSEPEEVTRVNVTINDRGKLAPQVSIRFLVDSGVSKTLISEKVWKAIQSRAGQAAPRLKRCTTKFRPYGTQPILGRSK